MLHFCTAVAIASIGVAQPQDKQDATGRAQQARSQATEAHGLSHASLEKLMDAKVSLEPSAGERREAREDGEVAERPSGEIQDFVVDLESGKLGWAAVSVGGFIGIGDKVALIPTSSLRPEVVDGEPCFRLSMTEEEIKNLPEFDADKASKNLDATVRTLNASYPVNDARETDEVVAAAAAAPRHMLASAVLGCDLKASDETFGDITNAVVDCTTHRVSHLLVSRGGLAGIGDTVYIVPFQATDAVMVEKKPELMVNRPVETLKACVEYKKPEEGFVDEAALLRADSQLGTPKARQ